MQPQQRAAEQLRDVPDLRADFQVVGERRRQAAHRRLDLDVVAARSLLGAALEEVQKRVAGGPADLGGAGERGPLALQGDRQVIPVALAHREAADPFAFVTSVARQPAHEALDDVGADGGVLEVAQFLARRLQAEKRRLIGVEVGSRLAQQVDEVLLERRGRRQALPRTVRHAEVQKHRDVGVVGGDAEMLEIGQRLVQRMSGQTGGSAELVGADALVRVRQDEALDELEQA